MKLTKRSLSSDSALSLARNSRNITQDLGVWEGLVLSETE